MTKKVVKRGDVYYVKSSPNLTPIGSEIWSDRPALIVSNDISNKKSNVVQIVYLTSSHRRRLSPMHVELKSIGEQSMAMCEQIHTVDKSRIEEFIGTITEQELQEIDKSLCFNLGIREVEYRGVFRKWENYINKNNVNVQLEQEYLIETSKNNAIIALRKELELTRQERNAYKTLYQIKQKTTDKIKAIIDDYESKLEE